MESSPPIACSLEARELSARIAEIRALGRDGLISRASDGALRFRPDHEIRDRLEAVVAAESRCCPFLGFELAEKQDALILHITAPPDAEPVAEELRAAFAAG